MLEYRLSGQWFVAGIEVRPGAIIEVGVVGEREVCGACGGYGEVTPASTRPGGVPGVYDFDNPYDDCRACGGSGWHSELVWHRVEVVGPEPADEVGVCRVKDLGAGGELVGLRSSDRHPARWLGH